MSSKLIITDIVVNGRKRIFSGLTDENGFYQIQIQNSGDENIAMVGDIFVGKVKDVVKNINSAFIKYSSNEVGYYSIEENKHPIFLNKKNTDKLCEGDELLVQVSKSAVKTKSLTLTSNISFPGRYIVLNLNKNGIGFSNKINLKKFKEDLKNKLGTYIKENNNFGIDREFGVVVRTNAQQATIEEICEEVNKLAAECKEMLKIASKRTCFTRLKSADMSYIRLIKGMPENDISDIITDNIDIYSSVKEWLEKSELLEFEKKLSLYNDELLELYKLYSIEKVISRATERNVWLKSGAYLVIEPTEAMTVIDVNTGKYIKGKKSEETMMKINIEASREIAYQLRLRNLSGIIIVDFINMELEENKNHLMRQLEMYLREDTIKTTLVEMTKLNLVEITRKKIDPPIYEQINK